MTAASGFAFPEDQAIARTSANAKPRAAVARLEAQSIFDAPDVLVPGLAGNGAAIAGVDALPARVDPNAELGVHDRRIGVADLVGRDGGSASELLAVEDRPTEQLGDRADAD